jgi:ABC-type amino acid transport substrate-binding protein
MKWLYLLLFFNTYVQAETITVALSFEGNPPYSFGEKAHRGIYIDLFQEIFKLTPYQLKFVYLSSARIRNSFHKGEIDIECCPIASWRKNESDISLYSQPIFETSDVYIFPQGKVRGIKVLSDETIATINGYGYAFDLIFTRYDVENELKLLKLIEHERLSVGIVDSTVVVYLSNIHHLTVETGQIHEYSSRPLRVHKSKAHIIPFINQAISEMKQQGKISAIIAKYTNNIN